MAFGLITGESAMFALLTNDDGIYAPGLAALEGAVKNDFETLVVAPSTEQSGVGHGITFLSPLTAKEVFRGEKQRGWAVDGSPGRCCETWCFQKSVLNDQTSSSVA